MDKSCALIELSHQREDRGPDFDASIKTKLCTSSKERSKAVIRKARKKTQSRLNLQLSKKTSSTPLSDHDESPAPASDQSEIEAPPADGQLELPTEVAAQAQEFGSKNEADSLLFSRAVDGGDPSSRGRRTGEFEDNRGDDDGDDSSGDDNAADAGDRHSPQETSLAPAKGKPLKQLSATPVTFL